MRLVDNEQNTSTTPLLGEGEIGDALQQRPLSQSLSGDAESGRDQVQKIVSGELRCDYLGDCKIALIDRRQQVIDENGFAGTDLSSDDDEALAVVQPIDEIGHRLPVHRALVKESSIGSELERRFGKPVEILVHG